MSRSFLHTAIRAGVKKYVESVLKKEKKIKSL